MIKLETKLHKLCRTTVAAQVESEMHGFIYVMCLTFYRGFMQCCNSYLFFILEGLKL